MKNWIFSIVFIVSGVMASAQVTITTANLQSLNITPSELCRISTFNLGEVKTVFIEAQIRNSENDNVLKVQTTSFQLAHGVVNIDPYELAFSLIDFGHTSQGNYVRARRQLPTGFYQYCVNLVVVSNEGDGDTYCEEISSMDNAFLLLINPDDKEVIETKNPLLIWMHSEPFEVLMANESFRLILVDLDKDQSAQTGVTINPPLFFANNVLTHNVPYPFDAPELKHGHRYGWQVQRISNGVIIDRTEAWEFKYKSEKEKKEIMYAGLKRNLDSGFYPVVNDKIYFKFEEKYNPNEMECRIVYPAKKIDKVDSNNNKKKQVINYKENGYNQFELDLSKYNLRKGYYVLEVQNEKKDVFKLKFLIE